jgi:hypothetical protein
MINTFGSTTWRPRSSGDGIATGSGLQTSSSASRFVTCANGVMELS